MIRFEEGVKRGLSAIAVLGLSGAPCWAQTAQEERTKVDRVARDRAAQERAKAESAAKEMAEQDKAKAAARETEDKPARRDEPRVRRVFQLKHIDPVELLPVLNVFPIERHASQKLRTLSVSGSAEMVAVVEETIRRFDVPPPTPAPPSPSRNIDLTVYLLVGQEQSSSEIMPPALQGVISQLTNLFPYKGYRLAETLVMRTRDGNEGSISGVISLAPKEPHKDLPKELQRAPYEFGFRRAFIGAGDKDRQIRLDKLHLKVEVPLPVTVVGGDAALSWNYRATGLTTDIDIREGQKVVVGKATVDGSSQALILVVTAKVVD